MSYLIHWTVPYISTVLIIGLFAFSEKKRFLYIIPLVILWTGTLNFAGVGISAEKVFLALIILYISIFNLININSRTLSNPVIPYFRQYFFLIFYLCVYSLVVSFLTPESNLLEVKEGNLMQKTSLQMPPLRGVFSTALFFATVLAIHFPFPNRPSYKGLQTILRIMFWSAIIVMLIFGAEIFVRILVPSLDFIFARLSFDNTRIIMPIADLSILSFRPSLFSSEPKYFGLAFGNIAAFAILQRRFPQPNMPNWITSPLFIFACLLCMVSSASLTAITSFLLGSIGMVIFTRSKEIKSRNRISNVFWIFLGLGFATLIFNEGSYLTERAGMYIQLLQNGFSGTSLDASLSTTAYLLWMLDDPGNLLFGVGFGNGAFYAYDYIATLSGFAERGFTSSRVPIIDLISSIGFFGALLLYLLWFKWLSYIFNFSRKLSLINFRELTFIRGGIAYYLFAGLIYSTNIQIWLLFGLAFTIISNYKRAKKIGQF